MKRSGHHVMLAVPTRGAIRWETVTRLDTIRDATPGLRPIVYQPGNLSVALTRNRIVKEFFATDCELLVMVDDDVVPPPTMLETFTGMTGFGIAAIPHPMPDPDNHGRLILTAWDEDGHISDLEDGWNEVGVVATGCCAVTRHALSAMRRNPFSISNDPDNPVSDDFLFCRDLRAAGFTVGAWMDGWYADHVTTVSLAPLHEATMLERSTR